MTPSPPLTTATMAPPPPRLHLTLPHRPRPSSSAAQVCSCPSTPRRIRSYDKTSVERAAWANRSPPRRSGWKPSPRGCDEPSRASDRPGTNTIRWSNRTWPWRVNHRTVTATKTRHETHRPTMSTSPGAPEKSRTPHSTHRLHTLTPAPLANLQRRRLVTPSPLPSIVLLLHLLRPVRNNCPRRLNKQGPQSRDTLVRRRRLRAPVRVHDCTTAHPSHHTEAHVPLLPTLDPVSRETKTAIPSEGRPPPLAIHGM